LSFLKSLSAQLAPILALYGGWGLLAISFLDSSFLSFPLVNDLLLIHLSSQYPGRVLIYALQSTAGSLAGAYVTYVISRRAGQLFLRKVSKENMARARHWLDRNDFVSILVASLLPPPAPFKVFLITAGVLRVDPVRFGAALLVGRGTRFLAVGFLGARYGAQAEAYLKANLGWVSLVVVGVVIGVTVISRWLARRRAGVRLPGTPDRSSPPRT